jgi:hypothetical protein
MTNTNFDLNDAFFDDDNLADVGEALPALVDDKLIQSPDSVLIPKSKMVLVKRLLQNIKENNDNLIQILGGMLSAEDEAKISIGQGSDDLFSQSQEEQASDARIVEGVFDGENMIGPDGKVYSVPANYASKSKLVEGDIMKLTITAKGTFVYKQIGPIERSRVVGLLEKNQEGNYYVTSGSQRWRVLTASVTYFKGNHGDEAVILIPKSGESKWSAIENVVHTVKH